MSKTLRQQLDDANVQIREYLAEALRLQGVDEENCNLRKECNTLQSEVAELNKKLASSESTKDVYRTSSTGYQQELNQLHEVLDALPGSIPKRAEESYQDRSVLTRLAAWLGSTK